MHHSGWGHYSMNNCSICQKDPTAPYSNSNSYSNDKNNGQDDEKPCPPSKRATATVLVVVGPTATVTATVNPEDHKSANTGSTLN
jgi:hypothetical protein